MKTRTHVFAVAVEVYQKQQLGSVDFAENDARAFVAAWQALGADPADCVTLLNANATKTALESSFKKFIKAVAPDDTAVFFFAGHGRTLDGKHYLLAHDTQLDDLEDTSVSLAAMLKQFRANKSGRVLLFLDACDRGRPVSAGTERHSSDDELTQFCAEGSNRVAFTACSAGEASWPGPALKQSLWTHAVITALAGDAREALENGSLLTAAALQAYLSKEVPRLLREARTGAETQTPCGFGIAAAQFTVADLAPLLDAKTAQTQALPSAFKNAVLRGAKSGAIRKLSGFKSFHRLRPDRSEASNAFVKQLGHEDVKLQADAIYSSLRDTFNFKRKDINYQCTNGMASINTPDFDVNLWIGQDAADTDNYSMTTEVTIVRRPGVVLEDGFSDLFSDYCDTVVIEFSRRLSVEDKIDAIEAVPEYRSYLRYEPDCSSLTLNIPEPGIRIHVTPHQMTLSLVSSANLKVLMTSATNALAILSGSGVDLLLPEAAR